MTGDISAVLVAAADPDAVEQYRSWLADEYRVVSTTDGDDALSRLEDVAAVVVGRRLRTTDGTVVARAIERRGTAHAMAALHDRTGPECASTGGERLVRPVTESTLLETVDRLCRRARYDELTTECATLAARRGALEAHTSGTATVDCDEEYARLQRRLEELFAEVDELVETFDRDDFQAAFGSCTVADSARSQRISERS